MFVPDNSFKTNLMFADNAPTYSQTLDEGRKACLGKNKKAFCKLRAQKFYNIGIPIEGLVMRKHLVFVILAGACLREGYLRVIHSGRLLGSTRLGSTGLFGTHNLVYFASSSLTQKKN